MAQKEVTEVTEQLTEEQRESRHLENLQSPDTDVPKNRKVLENENHPVLEDLHIPKKDKHDIDMKSGMKRGMKGSLFKVPLFSIKRQQLPLSLHSTVKQFL